MKLTAKCMVHRTKMMPHAAIIEYGRRMQRYYCVKFPDCDYYIQIEEPTIASCFRPVRIPKRQRMV